MKADMPGNTFDVHEIFLKEDEIQSAKLVTEPSEYSVEELKRWLECYGLKKNRKKHEFVEILKELLKLSVKVDPKVDEAM